MIEPARHQSYWRNAMFQNATVFILGAGASWHYGYPTGEELVKMVIERADAAARYFSIQMDAPMGEDPVYVREETRGTGFQRPKWRRASNDAMELASRLRQVNPLVIDYFLGQISSLQRIGKLLIAWSILESEATYIAKRGNINRYKLLQNSPVMSDRVDPNNFDTTKYRDDWYRFIIHKLVANCADSTDLLQNDVRFITFNYDVSLKRALYSGLNSIETLDGEDINKFLSSDRILHIYGRVRDVRDEPPSLDWDIPLQPHIHPDRVHHKQYKDVFDVAYYASRHLRVIDPKEVDGDVIKSARDAIKRAKCVYILGYGFDENNSKRLDLHDALRYDGPDHKCVLFTNFKGINRIKKAASRLFFHRSDRSFDVPIGEPKDGHYFEMSTRDTYEALELDFDALEEQLIAGTAI